MRGPACVLSVLLALWCLAGAAFADGNEENALCYDQFRAGDARLAIYHCTRAIQSGDLSDTELVTALLNRGVAHKQLGNLKDAIGDYTAALRRSPDDALIHSNRANAYRELGEYGFALADANRALELDLGSARAFYVRGAIFEAIGDADSARKDYRRAHELAPQNAAYREKAEAFAAR